MSKKFWWAMIVMRLGLIGGALRRRRGGSTRVHAGIPPANPGARASARGIPLALLNAAAALALSMTAFTAQASVVTFDNAPYGAPFAPYTEDGFKISTQSGSLFNSNFGNPGNDLEADLGTAGGVASFSAADGSQFTFTRLDYALFAERGSGSVNLNATGFRGGVAVGTESFPIVFANGDPRYTVWTTFNANNLSGVAIDELRITLAIGSVFDPILSASAEYLQAIDNVTFGVAAGPGPGVPEPATWAMMIVGCGLVGGVLRGRRAAASPGVLGRLRRARSRPSPGAGPRLRTPKAMELALCLGALAAGTAWPANATTSLVREVSATAAILAYTGSSLDPEAIASDSGFGFSGNAAMLHGNAPAEASLNFPGAANISSTSIGDWTSAETGAVTMDWGWTVNVSSGVMFNTFDPSSWTYSFIASDDGFFNISGVVTASGDAVGIRAIRLGGSGSGMFGVDAADPTGSASYSIPIASGQAYTFSLANYGGRSSDTGLNTTAAGHATFAWNISYGVGAPVPEPAAWITMILGLGLAGSAIRRRYRGGYAIRL